MALTPFSPLAFNSQLCIYNKIIVFNDRSQPSSIGNRTLMALMNNLPVRFEQNVMNNTFPLAYLYAKKGKSCQCIETFLKDFPISNSAQTEKKEKKTRHTQE